MPMSLEDLTALVEKQNELLEKERKAQDEVNAQVEEHGKALPETKEALAKITEDFDATREELQKAVEENDAHKAALEELNKQTTERLDAFETMLKRVGRGPNNEEEFAAEIKAASDFFTARRSRQNQDGRIQRVEPDEEQMDTWTRYCRAFGHYIRYSTDHTGHGADLDPDMRKELSVGIEPDGGYWVVPAISDRVITRVFETSPIRQIASVVTISTDSLKYPTDTNDATTGGWVGEKQSRPETGTPQVGEQEIFVREQYAEPHATQKLLDDAAFDVESWLGNKIADKLGRVENTAFVTGNGESKPRGFTDYGSAAVTTDDASRSWGVLQYAPSGKADDFDDDGTPPDAWQEFIDLVHKLKPVFRANATWVWNRATSAKIRKFRDNDGLPVWQMGNIQQGQPDRLLGFPALEAEDMPDVAANAFPVAFGDFREGYTIVDRQGIRTLRDPFTAKPFVKFYTTKRVGGDVVNFDAIKLMKIATS